MEYKHLLKHISHIISDHHWSHLAKNSRCRPPTGKRVRIDITSGENNNCMKPSPRWGKYKGTIQERGFWRIPSFFFNPFPFNKKSSTSSFHKKGGTPWPRGDRSQPQQQPFPNTSAPCLRATHRNSALASLTMAQDQDRSTITQDGRFRLCFPVVKKSVPESGGTPPRKGSWSIPVRMLMDTTASNFETHRNERLTLSWALGSTKDKLCEKDHRRPTRYSVHLIPIQTSQINLITKTDYRASYGMYISASMGIYTRWRLFNLFRWYG